LIPEKIVIELRDKLGAVDGDSIEVSGDIDVIEALKALGYSPEQAREVLRKIPKDIGTGARLPVTDASGNMVIDIGGGTTEIAVISLGGVVIARSLRVAGDEMNEDIVRYCRDEFNLLVGER
jgi:rod shape-determining protein MreB